MSFTWKVKEPRGEALAFALGVNFKLGISATNISWPAVTATLLRVSVPAPAAGSVVMITAAKLFAPLVLGAFASVGSVKPKSLAANVYDAS